MNYSRMNYNYDFWKAKYCGGEQRQNRMFARGYQKEYPRSSGYMCVRGESIWDMLDRLSKEYEEVIFCWEANKWCKGDRVYFAMVRGEKERKDCFI